MKAAFARHFARMSQARHPFAAHAAVDEGYNAIMNGHIKAVIAAGYVVVYDIGSLWYSSAQLLIEEMVLRLGEVPGDVAAVPAMLDELARLYGCQGVVSGNAIQRPGLSRVYEKAGYMPVATRFYKEIPIERSSENNQEGG